MNKLLKREFLPQKQESQSYTNKNNETKIVTSLRKRWYLTIECHQCFTTFKVLEKNKEQQLNKPCKACSLKNTAYKKFIEKSYKRHGEKFDYSLITQQSYVNLFTPVTIICKKHGPFSQKPKDHTSSANAKLCCPKCIEQFNKTHNKRSIESWKKELAEKAPHITMLKHGNSDSNTEQCTLECKHHGTFTTTLAAIKNDKYICQLCAQDHNSWGGRFRRTDIPGILYFVYIPGLSLWKLGVTSQTPEKRLRNLEHSYKVIWQYKFDTLAQAYKAETYLFRKYKDSRRPKTLPDVLGKCKGNTELMTCNIPITAIHDSNIMSKET